MLKKNQFIFFVLFLAFFALLSLPKSVAADDNFNPNIIISDAEILDSTTMNLTDIQEFLQSKGSYLANYSTLNADGVFKTAAEIIYDAAVNNYDCDSVDSESPILPAQKPALCKKISINPKFLLVLLQKEQGLIEDNSPIARSLDWATGYGCPDSGGCNPHWKGFGKQVNSAALQFYDYLINPQLYTYQAGNTYTFKNTDMPDMVVTPINKATAALYNYTPHVYNGNYNFWKLWLRYFTYLYPNNTLLQARGETGVWLIEDGKKRPFITRGALTSRFDVNKIVTVNSADLDKFPTGVPIKFSQYSLVRSPRGTVFLLVDDQRRGFASREALRKIGVNPEEIIDVSWDDLNVYKDGTPITATSTYPTGALLQDKKTGGVYYVVDGKKAPIWDKVLLKTKFKYKLITPVTSAKLNSYPTIEPAIFNDGEILKSNVSIGVYVIDNKTKRPFASGEVFEKMGYQWKNIITVPDKILDLYPLGQSITQEYIEEFKVISQPATASTSTSTAPNSATSTIATTTTNLQEEIFNVLHP
ncbi:MAG: hypothetical protein NTW06_02215 [Candidatus Falkowbacteria bacterium]|nr:hypothetical protein [Candidatus Falkowbacteria bacterium]